MFSERIAFQCIKIRRTGPIYSAFLSLVLVFDVHLLHEIPLFFKNFHATIWYETIKSYIKEKIIAKLYMSLENIFLEKRKREKNPYQIKTIER